MNKTGVTDQSAFCFVIMPFGGRFDDIYHQIYVPAIEAAGLNSLRADDIYDNQPIQQDIFHSIENASLILADVSGRNPNVNYELGIARGLKKEVVIVTSNPDDVPSDYQHLRYLQYDCTALSWDQTLRDKLTKTLSAVWERLRPAPGFDRPYSSTVVQCSPSKNGQHYFYRLKDVLPLSAIKAPAYAPDESHWLADWDHSSPRFHCGDTISFRITKVGPLQNWPHISNA